MENEEIDKSSVMKELLCGIDKVLDILQRKFKQKREKIEESNIVYKRNQNWILSFILVIGLS
jgi:hypothetical protein